MTQKRSGRFVPASAEQLNAISVIGGVEKLRDGAITLEPAYGNRAVNEVLKFAQDEDEDLTAFVMAQANLTKDQQRKFKSYNKVVRTPMPDGGRPEVIPRIPGITNAPLESFEDLDGPVVNDEHVVIDDAVKKYQLHAIFSDEQVMAKLSLSPRVVERARRQSVVNAAEAAALLTQHLHLKGYPNYSVIAGNFVNSRAYCIRVIREMTQGIKYIDGNVPAMVTAKDIHLTYDGIGEVSKRKPLWTVKAPLKYAVEAQCVYQLAIHHGPEHILFLLSNETAILDIQIYDEQTERWMNGQVGGFSSLDGVKPMGVSYPPGMTADQNSRLFAAARKVVPVQIESGSVIGSAIRVTNRHIIVNTHTLTSASEHDFMPTINDVHLRDGMVIGEDMTTMELPTSEYVQWALRPPIIGEKVVLCYNVGDCVEYSDVLRVLSLTTSSMTLSRSERLRPGCSGAAVVALSDFSLLGMFVTATSLNVRATIFHQRYLSDIIESDLKSAADSESDADLFGEYTYQHMRNHGLASYLDALVHSVALLYNQGQIVGMVANYGGNWVTKQPVVDAHLLNGDPLQWKDSGGFRLTDEQPGVLQVAPNHRPPVAMEKACLLVKDEAGVLMSKIIPVIIDTNHAGQFTLCGLPLEASSCLYGIVVAVSDGALIGHVYSEHMFDSSKSYVCVYPYAGLHREDSPVSLVEFMQMPRVDAVLTAAVNSEDVGLLAHIGGAAIDMRLSAASRVVVKSQTFSSVDYYTNLFEISKSVGRAGLVTYANSAEKYKALVGIAVEDCRDVLDELVLPLRGDGKDTATPTRLSFGRTSMDNG